MVSLITQLVIISKDSLSTDAIGIPLKEGLSNPIIGGVAGAIIWFLIRTGIGLYNTRKKIVCEYLCANELNQGQTNESDGELMHHHGRRISDIEELKFFQAKNAIWEWTSKKIGKGEGFAIIYGPYTTDFQEPGMYSVTFTMKAVGLKPPETKLKDFIVLELDINSSIPDYMIDENKN